MTEPRTRLPDWRLALSNLVRTQRDAPFAWGTHDCALWAADGMLAVSGVDIGADFRGTYSTAMGALKALKRKGFDTPEAVFPVRVGPALHVSSAMAGDIVAADLGCPDGWATMGVCAGAQTFFIGEGDEGLVMMNTIGLVGARCYHV